MAALNWSVFCVTLALILSVLHPCHSIRLLLTCIVMDTHALVADPHFSVPHCRSLFSIIHLTRFFSPLVPFFSPFFPFMSPITTPFYISHYVTLLLRHAFFPLFFFFIPPHSQRMQVSSMYEHCVRMKLLSQRLCMLKVTQEEFLCMKALVLLSISESPRTMSNDANVNSTCEIQLQ